MITNISHRERLGVLDGLRGLMCLWVVIGHSCAFTGMNALPIFRSPHYAVDGFMLLSGFLMTFHYILRREREPWTSPNTWLTFYIRRFFRISPLYFLTLAPAFVFLGNYSAWRLALHHAFMTSNAVPEMPAISPENVLSHVSFVFGLWPKYHASLVIPDWSLSLEMQFYLLFPFLVLIAMRIGWIAFSCIGSVIYVLAQSSMLAHAFVLPSPLPLSLLWFVIGMVWASSYVDLQDNRRSAMLTALFAASLSLVSGDPHDILLVGIFCWLLFSDHPLAAGKFAESVRQALSGKLSRFLAGASYSVYLVHLLILTPLAYFLYDRTSLRSVPRFVIVFAVTAALSYAIAKPLEIIERLGISWGKRLSATVADSSGSMVSVPASPAV